jgi:polysaccharide export outer membrane protein
MTPPRFIPIMFGLPSAVVLASCSLISETGPLKSSINNGPDSYVLIEVSTPADIPAQGRKYGLAEVPPRIKGPAYSDKVRSRDVLDFVITDLSEQSPFHTAGSAYKYGPLEVPDDGRISIPYVGEIQVIGQSLSEISKDLNARIKPVSNSAEVAVIRPGRLPRYANVMGEVKTPGPVPLERDGLTSLDLLAASGGPTQDEHLFKYSLRRNGADYQFDYVGFRSNAFPVEEGDLLSVSRDSGNRFHVMGAINRPLSVAFPSPEPTLTDALGAATGFDERRSDPSGVFVFRKGSPDTVFTFNLRDPSIIPLIQRFPIQGEDIVYVTEAPLSRWNRLISQFLPGQVFQAAGTATQISN